MCCDPMSGKAMPSWPRDEFEGYLDALKTDAEDALGGE
jgi:hypothetical protein